MEAAPKPPNESERLAALERLQILDTMPESDFDDITFLAAQICGTPIALISLIDESRQWFKSRHGLNAIETPREYAFCSHAILQPGTFVVPDATLDHRFKDNPLVTGDPKVRFYAAAPLLSPDGFAIGTICVIDHNAKTLTQNQEAALVALSNQVHRLLELRQRLSNEKRYSETLEYKRTAIENLSEGVVLQDSDYRIVEFNSAALETLGLTADQLTGKSSLDPEWRAIRRDGSPFPGEEHPAVVALATGQKQKQVLMGVHQPNSALRWININSTPIFFKDSAKANHVVSSFSDVTAERNSELIIEKNQADLSRVLNGVPAMIGHWSRELININANKAYTDFFGKRTEAVRGEFMGNIVGSEMYMRTSSYVNGVLAGKIQSFEQSHLRPDGEILHTLDTYLPEIVDAEVTGFFVIMTDVTNLKRLEDERQALASKMVESSKLSTLGEMAGGVAHEINTPLAIIYAKTSMLLEQYERGNSNSEETMRQLGKIKSTAERISKIVKGLRLFSRNSKNDPLESISLNAVFESVLDLCQEKLVHARVHLISEVLNNACVAGRFPEMSQVLMNLISNSVDAVEHLNEKWIRVRIEIVDRKIILSVSDSGPGIPSDIADKIMAPFFTTKEVGKGTGLGLSIS